MAVIALASTMLLAASSAATRTQALENASPGGWTLRSTSLDFTTVVCPSATVCDAIGSAPAVARSTKGAGAGRYRLST